MADGQEIIDMTQGSALSSAARAEIDIQIATAHAYPRVIKKCKDNALALATLTPEIAEQMGYALPRAGNTITGISIRLAEIMASTWGNLRYGSRLVDEGQKFVIVEGFCHDLESNSAVCLQVSRRITNRQGKRYGDDMVQTTIQAASSIALRNAIFRIVPRAYAEEIYREAMAVAFGDAYALAEKRVAAIKYFAGLGAPEAWVLATLGRSCIDDVTRDDMQVLAGFKTALDDGETTLLKLFPDPEADEKAAAKDAEKPKDELDKLAEEGREQSGGASSSAGEKQEKAEEKPKGRRRTHETQEKVKTCGIDDHHLKMVAGLREKIDNADAIIKGFFGSRTDLAADKHGELTWLNKEEGEALVGFLQELYPVDEGGEENAPAEEPQTEEAPPSEEGANEEPADEDAPPFAEGDEVVMANGASAKVLKCDKGITGNWRCDVAALSDGEEYSGVAANTLKK